MTEADILAGILRREGGFRHVPGDRGGATNFGITQATLGSWRKLGRPATPEEVRALTPAEASDIYRSEYIAGWDRVPYAPLRAQLVDFGVNSGPQRASRWLERILGFPATGQYPPSDTLIRVLQQLDTRQIGQRPALALVNDALVAARSYMIDATEDAGQLPASDEEGVESRALSFFLATPSARGPQT